MRGLDPIKKRNGGDFVQYRHHSVFVPFRFGSVIRREREIACSSLCTMREKKGGRGREVEAEPT